MADEKSLSAEFEVDFGFAAHRKTFTLDVSDEDGQMNKPVMLAPMYVWSWWYDINYTDRYKDVEVLQETDHGAKIVRLYAPVDLPVEVFATEIPEDIVGQDWNAFLGPITPGVREFVNRVNTAWNSQWSFQNETDENSHGLIRNGFYIIGRTPEPPTPPSVQYLGVAERQVVENVEFNGERFVQLKYNYATQARFLYATKFRNRVGDLIAPPVFLSKFGTYGLTEDGFGAALVSYTVKYRMYRINYSLPSGKVYPELQKAWLQGDITKCQMPPVMVIAVGDEQTATTDFDRDVYPKGAYLGTWYTQQPRDETPQLPSNFTEKSRKEIEKKIENPDDPDQFVTIKVPREVRFTPKAENTQAQAGFMKITRTDGKQIQMYAEGRPDGDKSVGEREITLQFDVEDDEEA